MKANFNKWIVYFLFSLALAFPVFSWNNTFGWNIQGESNITGGGDTYIYNSYTINNYTQYLDVIHNQDLNTTSDVIFNKVVSNDGYYFSSPYSYLTDVTLFLKSGFEYAEYNSDATYIGNEMSNYVLTLKKDEIKLSSDYTTPNTYLKITENEFSYFGNNIQMENSAFKLENQTSIGLKSNGDNSTGNYNFNATPSDNLVTDFSSFNKTGLWAYNVTNHNWEHQGTSTDYLYTNIVPEINATYLIIANVSVSSGYIRIYLGGTLITGVGLWSSSGVYTETIEASAITNISIQASQISKLNNLSIYRLDNGNIKANNIQVTGGQLQVPTGTLARPGLAFSKYPDTGFYLIDSTSSTNAGLGFSVAGARAIQIVTGGFLIESRIGFAGNADLDLYAGTSSGILQIRRGTSSTPSKLELHNYYTSSSIREYANIGFKNNNFIINVTNSSGGISRPIILNDALFINETKDVKIMSNLTINGLSGTGNNFVCADASGKLYRSVLACA